MSFVALQGRSLQSATIGYAITPNPVRPYIFDSKWYTEICNDEAFKVSGHFRLQPYGDGTRRLIWINEFTKNGYHRKATIDKVKDGDIILT